MFCDKGRACVRGAKREGARVVGSEGAYVQRGSMNSMLREKGYEKG